MIAVVCMYGKGGVGVSKENEGKSKKMRGEIKKRGEKLKREEKLKKGESKEKRKK